MTSSLSEPVASTSPVVRTNAGAIRGTADQQALAFLGVPYTAPPVGPLRFAAPCPHPPWNGVREATGLSSAFLQPPDDSPVSAEDALYANVWTPGLGGRRPVFVYIHGGGWQVHSSVKPTYNGARLAVRGQMVVVTFNYRLGPFGFGLHEQLADSTGGCSNWGLQDQAALIEWVRDNIAAFGGDPDNITVCGTSAGGSSAWQLARLPHLRPTIRRIIPISAAHVWPPAYTLEPEDSRTAFEAVAERLGSHVSALRDLPAEAILSAWREFFAGIPAEHPVRSGRWFRGPVVDGRWMPDYDHRSPVPDVPTMAINTDTEGSFYTVETLPHPTDERELRGMVADYLLKGTDRVPDSLPEELVEHYRAAARRRGGPTDPVSLYTEIYGDGVFRYQIVRLAERAARESTAPQYLMHFDYTVSPPAFGSPHEATSPFLFGTHGTDLHRRSFGDGPLEQQVAAEFMDLVSSFAHGEPPHSAHCPRWPEFTPDRASTLVLGGRGGPRVTEVPKYDQLRVWDRAEWVPRP